MATVTCINETGIGNKTNEFHLDLHDIQISLRELLRRRVYEEVQAPTTCFSPSTSKGWCSRPGPSRS